MMHCNMTYFKNKALEDSLFSLIKFIVEKPKIFLMNLVIKSQCNLIPIF